MHADHRQTDTVTERGRQETETQRGADRCMLTIEADAVTERETGKRHTERCRQVHADHRQTDAVT